MRSGKYFKVNNSSQEYHKIQCKVRVIEYQRRGLVRAHLILKFQDNFIPRYEDKPLLLRG